MPNIHQNGREILGVNLKWYAFAPTNSLIRSLLLPINAMVLKFLYFEIHKEIIKFLYNIIIKLIK
jgi:hypothetical protein